MRATLEHGPLDFKVAHLIEGFRGIDDQVIREQELRQRMISMRIERPIRFSIETVVEREIGVQACAVRAYVILGEAESVFVVVHVANLEIAIDLIEYFGAEADVLDFRPADACQPRLALAGRQSLADDCEHRPALQQSCPLDSEDNSEDILSVQSVGTDRLERQLSCRDGLSRHRTVKEERIRPLSRKDMQSFRFAAVFIIDTKRNGFAVRHCAAALLETLSRYIKRAIEGELFGPHCESAFVRRNRCGSHTQSVCDRIRKKGGRTSVRKYIQDQDEMPRTLRTGKSVDVGDV